jgi:hypothetical protein
MHSHIGLDFDNTIVKYDEVFHRYAIELFNIPPDIPADKPSIKAYFWTYEKTGGWDHWVQLQGIVYGEKMVEAVPTPGLERFLERCRSEKIRVSISSHKTEFPTKGPRVRLWDAAWKWLEAGRFFDPDGYGIDRGDVFFEKERCLKLGRVASQGCTLFVDDLLEVLEEKDFPREVKRLLYDPANRQHPTHPEVIKCRKWDDIYGYVTA